MENFKFQTIMLQILNINLDISDKIFSTIKFKDEKLENLYMEDEKEKSAFNTLLTDSMIIVGYIASLLYIILASYKESMLIMTIFSLIGSTILIMISNISKNPKLIKIFSHLKILLINVNLNLKAIIMSAKYNTKENDNSEEIMRVIIYDYFSTNLFILVKLESHLLNYIFYFVLNTITVLFAEKYSNKQHHYYLDAFTGFILFLIFYFLRRQWDLKSRKLFSEKYKFEKLFQYSIDFINGLNGYHINLKNNNIIFMDNRFKELYNELDYKNGYKLNEIFKYNPLIKNNENIPSKINCNNNLIDIAKNNKALNFDNKYEYFKINNDSALINSNNISIKIDNPSNLLHSINKLKKDQKNIDVEIADESRNNKTKDVSMKNKENEIRFNLFLDSLIYFEGKKFNILYENLFNDNISLFNKDNEDLGIDETLNTFNDNMDHDKKINFYKNFVTENEKSKEKNDIIVLENKEVKVGNLINSKRKFSNKNLNFELEKINDVENINKLNLNNESFSNNKKKSLLEELKLIQSSQIIIQEKFTHLGIYYFSDNRSKKKDNDISSEEGIHKSNDNSFKNPKDNNTNKKSISERKYFDVYLRRIRLNEQDDLICDIIFYDVTELILTRLKIYEESITKQKIIAKIANEFKTPLNSIIGIVCSLNFELNNVKEKFNNLRNMESSLQSFGKTPQHQMLNKIDLNFDINLLIKEIQNIDCDFAGNFKHNLSFISNLANYLNILTNDIIQYKNNLNDFTLSKSLISVKDLVIFCSEILKILINCKSKTGRINIFLNLDEEINKMFIFTDEIRIRQILLNFISNAVKFTKFGYISINCFKIENEEKIRISIDDSGQGIKEENKKKIFADTNIFNLHTNECFKDDDVNSLSKNNFDNGFGLCISKSLAKKLDYYIGFNSEIGKGSSFFLEIPFIIRDEDKSKNSIDSFEINNQLINFKSNLNVDEIRQENDALEKLKYKAKSNKIINLSDKNKLKELKDENSINDFEWSKIVKNDKFNSSKGTLILNNSTNFSNEIRNLNPNHSVLSLNNESENKAILKEINFSDTESRNEIRHSNFYNKNNDIISPKSNKLTTNVVLRKLSLNKNEVILPQQACKLEDRIATIKEVTIENYNDLSVLSNGAFDSLKIKENTTNNFEKKNKEISSFMNSSSEISKSTPKILIVQENQIEKNIMVSIMNSILKLHPFKYDLKVITDGEDLIDEVLKDRNEGFKIKCIILDENIKQLNGMDSIKIIKDMEKEEKLKNIKIICTITNDKKENLNKLIEVGPDLILKKPANQEIVCQYLYRLKLL